MTKTTREIEKEKNFDVFNNAVNLSSFIALILFAMVFIVLKNEISQLPHKVCHNETIIQTPEEFCRSIQEEGIVNYASLDEDKVICSITITGNNISFSINGWYDISKLKIEKEVCEIK